MAKRTNSMSRQPLSRDRILDTAIALADAEGIDAVSMRRVAAALGVQAMSLYNHVASKQDILDGVAARLIATVTAPDIATIDWRDLLGGVGRAYRQVGLDHPNVFPLVLERPFGAPESVATLDAALDALRRAGFSPTATYIGFYLLSSFVEGYTHDEITRRRHDALRDPVKNPVAGAGVQDRFPALFEVFTAGALDDDETFERCLVLVIDAIARLRS